MAQEKTYKSPVAIVNRRASFNYVLIDTFQAGIMLTGTEVKAVREGKANLGDSFCIFKKNELWVKNLHISEYKYGSTNNHEPMRLRKLLLGKKELSRLLDKVKERGLTIIPVQLYFNERGIVKMEIALAKGKKSFDKRDSIKERESKIDMDRAMKKAK